MSSSTSTRRGVTEQAAIAAVDSGTRVLRLPTIRDRFEEIAAAEAGHRVRYTLASKLVNELVEAADDRQLSKTIARYGRVDLLCLDLCRRRDYAEHGGERLAVS